MLRTLVALVVQFPIGIVLGMLKLRQKAYSPLWWCITSATIVPLMFIFFISNQPAHVMVTLVVSILCAILGQKLGGFLCPIGLTGGISTGKSTVAKIWREKRVHLIDADEIAREVVMPGRRAYKKLVDAFGSKILVQDDKTKPIDRKKLGDIIFNDPAQRKVLNSCTHPYIILEIVTQLLKLRFWGQQSSLVVLDAPLLYESRILAWICFPIIVVACPPSLQLARLKIRDELNEEKALARINSQMKLEEKIKRCNIVIDNSGTLEQLSTRAGEAIRKASGMIHGNFQTEQSHRSTI